MSQELKVSIGIFAHNEEENIGKAIESVLRARVKLVVIENIIVVSSGSMDGTNKIVSKFMHQDSRVKLLTQSVKNGKASAVNVFMSVAKSPILVTMSADLVIHPKAIESMCRLFLDKSVGMAGAHPKPLKAKNGKINREIELLWQLHHEVSLIKPKCGEMVTFRNVIRNIPAYSAVDEANIEVLMSLIGYRVVYAPDAVVYNRGPKTFSEYLLQRRRVQAGHHWVFSKYNYKVSTLEPSMVFGVVINHLLQNPKDLLPMLSLLGMEIIARIVGDIDYFVLGRNPYNWQMVPRN